MTADHGQMAPSPEIIIAPLHTSPKIPGNLVQRLLDEYN